MATTANMFAVKAHEDGTWGHVRGLAIPFGGPLNGKDLDGEYFTKNTDLAEEWFPDGRPLLYHHGMDGAVETEVIGRQTKATKEIDGVWVDAQLDKNSKWADSVWELVQKGSLFFSSGAMAHLVRKKSSGEITRWPWVEQTLTPTPANPFAVVTASKAAKAIKAAGAAVPDEVLDALERERAHKAAAPGMKADGPNGSPFSQEDINYRISEQFEDWMLDAVSSSPAAMLMNDQCCEAYVRASYPAANPPYVVVNAYSPLRGLYRVEYTVTNGEVVASNPVEVIVTYTPVKSAGELGAEFATVKAATDALLTTPLEREGRDAETLGEYLEAVKKGRAISTANAGKLKQMRQHANSAMSSAKSMMDMLDELLSMTEDGKARKAAEEQAALATELLREELELERMELEAMTLEREATTAR